MIPPPSAKLTQVNDHFIACDQRFEDMPEQDNGRLCQACDRVLLDFTKMPVHEMIRFQADNDFKHCGNYTYSQVQAIHYHLQAEEMPKRPGMGWLVSLAIGALGLTSLNAAAQETPNPTHKIEGHTLPWYPAYMAVPGNEVADDMAQKDSSSSIASNPVDAAREGNTVEDFTEEYADLVCLEGEVLDQYFLESIESGKVVLMANGKKLAVAELDSNGHFELKLSRGAFDQYHDSLMLEVKSNGYFMKRQKVNIGDEKKSNHKLPPVLVEPILFRGVILKNPE